VREEAEKEVLREGGENVVMHKSLNTTLIWGERKRHAPKDVQREGKGGKSSSKQKSSYPKTKINPKKRVRSEGEEKKVFRKRRGRETNQGRNLSPIQKKKNGKLKRGLGKKRTLVEGEGIRLWGGLLCT